MATITFKGTDIHTVGTLPEVGPQAPGFVLTNTELTDVRNTDFQGKNIILNIFPSLDTSVCATTVRRFNQEAANLTNTDVLCISMDLPFAQQRFCGAHGIENVLTLSAFRSTDFGDAYGVRITDGPLAGLLARALVGIDTAGNVAYTQQVPEIAQEPDYDTALKAMA